MEIFLSRDVYELQETESVWPAHLKFLFFYFFFKSMEPGVFLSDKVWSVFCYQQVHVLLLMESSSVWTLHFQNLADTFI